MEKIIQTLIDSWTKGVDTYTHNGSTWLIFTESKQWVIELTDSKTLWYNYNFFKQIFEFTSLDVVENQQYITKWVENNIINKVEHTSQSLPRKCSSVEDIIQNGPIDSVRVNEYSLNYVSKQRGCEDTIENGVKETSHNATMFQSMKVEDTIQNGVKSTISTLRPTLFGVDDIIQDGIKETRLEMNITEGEVDDIIQDGVKYTITSELRSNLTAENIIENGVKLTNKSLQTDGSCVIEDTIQNGVRHTEIGWHQCNNIDDAIEKGVKEIYDYKGHRWDVKDVIQDGVRDISPMTQYTDWQVEEIIENGVKETELHKGYRPLAIRDTIQHGIKYTVQNGVKETLNTEYMPQEMVEDTIENGVKHTEYGDWLDGDERLEDIIQNGVKKTKTPGNGDIVSTVEWMKENNSTSYSKMIDEVLENGVKETIHENHHRWREVVLTLKDGIRETHDDVYHHKDRVNGVIKNGVKEVSKGGLVQMAKVDFVIDNGIKEINPLPDQSGELIGYGNYYNGKEDRTKPFTEYVNDVIKNGEKF